MMPGMLRACFGGEHRKAVWRGAQLGEYGVCAGRAADWLSLLFLQASVRSLPRVSGDLRFLPFELCAGLIPLGVCASGLVDLVDLGEVRPDNALDPRYDSDGEDHQ